jgi:hypothetical protein
MGKHPGYLCGGFALFFLVACTTREPVGTTAEEATGAAGLLQGASTYVPLDANPDWASFDDGTPFTVDTRITGVQFHVPGVPSGLPGGLSPVPIPILKVENGVPYWRVTGELSAQIVDYAAWRYVVGPIGPDGVDHRFDPDRTHPRGQLPGAIFVLRYPVRGWNGALINHQAPNDGGFGYPPAVLTDLPLDPITLLDRGYALFSVGLGGTVYRGPINGQTVVDTNPDSGSGVFWNGDLADYLRPARIAADGSETAFPEPSVRTAHYDFDFVVDLGDPDFGVHNGVVMQWSPELARDGVVVAKNLLGQLTGTTGPVWTAFLGWSGSGGTADALASGRINGLINKHGGSVPYNGGVFNRFHDPSSGRRYDAFLVMAGGTNGYIFLDGTWTDEGAIDDWYPAAAPLAWMGGDADAFGLSLTGYIEANRIAKALPGSRQAGTPLEDLIALYNLHGVTHVPNEYLFSNARNQGGHHDLYYARPATFPDPSGLNRRGRGRPIQPIKIEQAQGGPIDEFGFWQFYGIPRAMPLFLQTLANLRALTTSGTPLPPSRVEGRLFARLPSLTADSIYPLYPDAPCPVLDFIANPDADFVASVVACAALPVQDSQMHAVFPDDNSPDGRDLIPRPIGDFFLGQARWFAAHNPLVATAVFDSVVVPDMAAALGPRLFFIHGAMERRLSDAELRVGVTAPDGRRYQYDNHAAYLRTFTDAGKALVAAGLWDPRLGNVYDAEAARSDVLTGH